jgi:hypothetical protein
MSTFIQHSNKRRFVGWHAQFEWKLADLWIGAFWKKTGHCIDLWICILPCVPLHVSWWWSREEKIMFSEIQNPAQFSNDSTD